MGRDWNRLADGVFPRQRDLALEVVLAHQVEAAALPKVRSAHKALT